MPKMITATIIITATIVAGLFWFFAPEAKASPTTLNPGPPAFDIERVKFAIIEVEGWNSKNGKLGEKGRLQFTFDRWSELTDLPFYFADRLGLSQFDRRLVDAVETKHIAALVTKIYSLGKRPTVYLIAEMHCAGFEAVRAGKVKAAKKDYASRVEAIYNDTASDFGRFRGKLDAKKRPNL